MSPRRQQKMSGLYARQANMAPTWLPASVGWASHRTANLGNLPIHRQSAVTFAASCTSAISGRAIRGGRLLRDESDSWCRRD